MWVRIPLAWFLYKKTFSSHIKFSNNLISSKPLSNRSNLRYSLNFKSIISPSSAHNVKLMMSTSDKGKSLVKQSYLMLTWFYYISRSNSNGGKSRKGLLPRFFIKPSRTSKFTMTKSPMAHKTFSQEQYKFKFFSISMSFSLGANFDKPCINSSLMLSQLVRNSYTSFETNLFFSTKNNF